MVDEIVDTARGTHIMFGGYLDEAVARSAHQARHAICAEAATGEADDLVAFGKAYIANPDLYERLLQNAPFNALRLESMIGVQSAEGYTDYPALA